MNKNIAIMLLAILVSSAGMIVYTNQLETINATEPQTNNIVICPNPDCPLHDPNYILGSSNIGGRPIDMEYSGSGDNKVNYLCQYCGTKW